MRKSLAPRSFSEVGFTLLEMLVVIGIIAVLVGFGALSYSTVQKKARDAKRQGDLKAAQQNLEQCYSGNTTSPYQYPVMTISGGTISAICPGIASLNFSITDPINSGTTVYVRTTSTTSAYTLTATLEKGGTYVVNNQQ